MTLQGGLKLFQRAVELDPNLAAAYGRLGATYLFLGNTELSEAAYTRAYQLRDRLTEKGRLGAEINYYSNVIGDWEKEYSSALRFLEIFPRDVFGHVNLREAFVHLGQPDRAADEAAEVARLRPSAYYFGSAIQSIRFASRFNEAKSWLAKADALKFDSSLIRRERLIVAFATGDRDNVEKILQQEERGKYREEFLNEHALIEIQRGRFQSAERLRLQVLGPTPKASNADSWVIPAALEDAEVGKEAQARRYEGKASASPLDRNNKIALAQALARSGRTAEAGALADQVSAGRPEDTLVQHYFVPTIRAAIKLRQHDPATAIELLRGTAKYDLAFTGFDYLYPAYIRGLAYLDLGDGRSAAAQFQKLIDNPGFTVRHVTGALAWIQLGRAQKMMGDEAAARKSYETFLDLWKNADPDIPIYQQAKAEYSPLYFSSAVTANIIASRFKEARSWLAQAEALKFDSPWLRINRFRLAFIEGERAVLDEIFEGEAQGPNRVDFLRERSTFEAQQGHFDSADRLQLEASKLSSDPGDTSWALVFSALRNAEAGRAIQARKAQDQALRSKLDRNNKMILALSLARSERTDKAKRLADEVSQEAPLDTIVRKYLVPTVGAAIKLQQHDPTSAIGLLRGTVQYDLADTQSFNYLYPAYIRGLAYLELGDGRAAAGEFQKLIDNPGLCWEFITGPLARLQLGRAENLMGDNASARES